MLESWINSELVQSDVLEEQLPCKLCERVSFISSGIELAWKNRTKPRKVCKYEAIPFNIRNYNYI